MTWLFNGAMGSVIVVTLFHAAFNISNNELVTNFMPQINRMFTNNEWIYPVLGVLALVLIVFTRGRLSYKAEHAPPTAEEATSSEVGRGISGVRTGQGASRRSQIGPRD
jgi:nicotinamide mononucleotide adenylyltransferase